MTIDDFNFEDKKALIRVDFNVPLDRETGTQVTNDARIRAALPSIRHVVEGGGALVLMSHLGRPGGEVNPEFSLAPVAAHLEQLLGQRVLFAPDCVGPEAEAVVAKSRSGEVVLLENLRFHEGETKNDPVLARQMAALGDPPWTGEQRFDESFERWVMDFQRRHGLAPDGIIGPRTLMYLLAPGIEEPRLLTSLDGKR